MKSLGLILSLFFLGACAHKNYPEESNVQITKDLVGNRWGNIYFSKQPSKANLESLNANKFKTVINLREKKEKGYNESWERRIAKEQQLNYYNIPFSMKNEMSDEYVEQVTSIVMKHRKEGKTLIHCSSGNRVGVWLGAHLKKDHKLSNKESLSLAKKLGLTNKKAIKKLENYLN